MKKFKIILIVMSVLFSFSSCEKNNNVNVSNSEKKMPQTLVVGIMPDLDSIPFAVAKLEGFLPENVKLEIFKSPVDRDSALQSGNLDGTISDILAVALAQNGGMKVYATSKTNGRYAILTAKNSEISSAKQLEGKQIGISVNTIIEYVVDRIVEEDNGDISLVEKLAVPKIPARLELLENNQIDAIGVPEPYVTVASSNGAQILKTSEDLDINPAVVLFTEKAINEKHDELVALYEAYNKAVTYIQQSEHSKFMPNVIEELGLPNEAINVKLPQYEQMILPDKNEIRKAVNWLVSKGIMEKTIPYDELVKAIK